MPTLPTLPEPPSRRSLEPSSPLELRLVVWFEPGSGWRARVSGPGVAEREFVSPFELARFVAWPLASVPPGRGPGLR